MPKSYSDVRINGNSLIVAVTKVAKIGEKFRPERLENGNILLVVYDSNKKSE